MPYKYSCNDCDYETDEYEYWAQAMAEATEHEHDQRMEEGHEGEVIELE